MTALQQTRPWFLLARGAVPTVSIDGSPPTEMSVLRIIPTSDVFEVRLLRAWSVHARAAVSPNGDVVLGNVLLVLTQRRER